MKINNIFSYLSLLLFALGLSGCEGAKDLIIIEGDLPIKTSTLYMVGDATPNGWSIDAPTPLTASEEDPLVFNWEGPLNPGEMKFCLTTGSWDAAFIRPLEAGQELGKAGIDDGFQMHAGDPDEKWKITDAGVYSLRLDLRNWKISATWLREQDAPVIEPIVAENVYIVGEATPNGWNIDAPTQLEKKSDFIFVYEGPLTTGEFKAVTTTGSWDAPFIRPSATGVKISKAGAEAEDFVYTTGPDNKWNVTEAAIYRLTFDLSKWTIKAEYTGDFAPAAKLYMIGESTPGGWSWDNAIVIEASTPANDVFVWEGELGRGSLKAALEKNFDAPFYRPAKPDVEISAAGVASHEMVFTTSPDDQWKVTVAGKYRLTFNTTAMTFDAVYLDGGTPSVPSLYMIGDATPGGWSLDDATEIKSTTKDLYVWEGELKTGEMKACLTRDFTAPFYRPAKTGVTISDKGASDRAMVFTTEPDDKWNVTVAGKYRLTFNTAEMTFEAQLLSASTAAAPLYMIGTATAGGWSLDDATEFTATTTEGEYTWTGHLNEGTFKACSVKDFGAPFYRPASADVEVSENGVASPTVVYTKDPDDQWKVTKAGNYRLVINIKAMTISAQYVK